MSDVVKAFEPVAPTIGAAALAGTVLTLLLSPLLSAMTVAAARAHEPLRVVALLQAGVAEYARLGRMLLLSILPLGVAFALAGMLMGVAESHAEKATLASSASRVGWLMNVAALIVVALLHMTVEAGRAQLAADPALRSVFVAWWRGVRLVARFPLAALLFYIAPTLLGGLAAMVLVLIRVRLVPASHLVWGAAFVVTQLIVAAIAWGRVSRLFALHALAAEGERRGR